MFVKSMSLTAAAVSLVLAPLASAGTVTLEPIGTYESGVFDESAAEIVTYDPATKQLFVVNANDATVDVLDITDPTAPTLVNSIDVGAAGDSLGNANSVDVKNGVLAVAIERDPSQEPGIVAFYATADLSLLGTVGVGALPDMLTFTPDGSKVLVANEGEPDDDYVTDPEGSISIIDISGGIADATVATADFNAFDADIEALRASGVRIFGPGASVSQDLEPEYIAVDPKGRTAWVALQEANALAIVDINAAQVVAIAPLGVKNHNAPGNELDASNRDDGINIRNWPVVGMYQPDAIASYKRGSETYILTANEGDSRDYDGFSEEERVGDLDLDPNAYPNAAELQLDENLGRLQSTTETGDYDGDGLIDQIHSYGARSFSIWKSDGTLVYDSGADFENFLAEALPADFNSNNDENDSFDARSDDKGPEPEGITWGKVRGKRLVFVGLERIGGIMVYDITNPLAPEFATYVNNRDFSAEDVESGGVGDLGPEGLKFIPWYESPNFKPLLVVGAEVSGTTTIYQVTVTR